MQEQINLYLVLMKKCLLNLIHTDPEEMIQFQKWQGTRIFFREEGKDWPQKAHTMIGVKRLDNLHYCVEQVIKNNIPGDLIETGVWRGGATILMRAILKAYGIVDRKVWVADSFEGLPPPDVEKYPQDENFDFSIHPELAISVEEVKKNFNTYGLLDDQVEFLVGWFKDTLPAAPIERVAVLRLDGDLYESTMDALTALYPKLSVGGYAIIDDYKAVKPCKEAVLDYRQKYNLDEEIIEIDWAGVYWKKEKAVSPS
jgi:hypothetical protein